MHYATILILKGEREADVTVNNFIICNLQSGGQWSSLFTTGTKVITSPPSRPVLISPHCCWSSSREKRGQMAKQNQGTEFVKLLFLVSGRILVSQGERGWTFLTRTKTHQTFWSVPLADWTGLNWTYLDQTGWDWTKLIWTGLNSIN